MGRVEWVCMTGPFGRAPGGQRDGLRKTMDERIRRRYAVAPPFLRRHSPHFAGSSGGTAAYPRTPPTLKVVVQPRA
ncbi:hypothetical protein RKE29_13320 [Streptomyces sp. B1866]|uniref:hypothetical protein n=1 Tax=Streptomyces sp. B1866 TaxID=3075431 RepID=UPI00288E4E1E|nr:hypothetical protein [Streptomyces sp. B1866]MDT3397620.1 hypothetical protein [Streptomyces sp. B1866]